MNNSGAKLNHRASLFGLGTVTPPEVNPVMATALMVIHQPISGTETARMSRVLRPPPAPRVREAAFNQASHQRWFFSVKIRSLLESMGHLKHLGLPQRRPQELQADGEPLSTETAGYRNPRNSRQVG
jgi:hypothetical protein